MKHYADLNEYLFLNRKTVSKTELAKRLGIWPSKLTTLLNPESYRVTLDDDLVQRIAKVLGQNPNHVKKLYETAA